MKFTTAAVLAASAVSAASIKRQADFYYVDNFSASCIPHSLLCNYNFTVMASSASQTPTVCALTLQGPDYLPEVPLQGCSGSPVYSWAVSAAPADDGDGVAGGLDLTITTALSAGVTNLTGTYLIPEGNLTVTDNGASSSQSYVGPEAFSVPTEVVPVDA